MAWHAAGTYRIAVLGDSFVEAMQVEDEHHFLNLSEKHFEGKARIELMNFGRSGFTQTEQLLVLQNDALQFSPDAVILFFFPPNDIADVSPETANDLVRPFYRITSQNTLELDTSFKDSWTYQFKKGISPLKNNSALVSLLTERYSQHRALKRMAEIRQKSKGEKTPGYLSLAAANPEKIYAQNYLLNKRLITEMAFLLRSKNIPFILAVIDTPDYLQETEKTFKEKYFGFETGFFEKDLRDFAASLGIGFLGLQTPFREAYLKTGKPLHWSSDREFNEAMGYGHWNYEGHRTAEEALSRKLEELLFSPDAP
jgi:hypothetical protein